MIKYTSMCSPGSLPKKHMTQRFGNVQQKVVVFIIVKVDTPPAVHPNAQYVSSRHNKTIF